MAHPEVVTTLQPQPQEDDARSSTPIPTPLTTSTPTITSVSPPSGAKEDLDAEHDDDAPLRFHTIDSILGPATPPGMAHWDQDKDLLLVNVDEPATLEQALGHECWRKAMLDEMTSIKANDTWELIDLPARQHPIGLKWVFKTKKDTTGITTKNKARLVAKGYVQSPRDRLR